MSVENFDIRQFLSQQDSFAQLPQPLLELAANNITITYHRQNQRLELESRLYLVRSGAVTLLNDKNEVIDTISEGESFGSPEVTSHHSSHCVIMAEDSLLYQLSADIIDKLCQLNKSFRRYYKLSNHGRIRLALAGRSDSLSMTTPVSKLLQRSAVTIAPEKTIRQAAQLMSEEKVSSLLISHEGNLLGIVTDSDMRRKVVASGVDTSDSIKSIMTAQPACVQPETFVFDAVLKMSRFNIHHLPVVTKDDITGLITTTDIVKLQRSQPVFLIGEIWKASNSQEMAKICTAIPDLFTRLVEADARAGDVSRILTAISDAVNQRLLELAEAKLGAAPIDYAWLAFGSQGREDQNLSSDQDNALLLANNFNRSEHGEYFDKLSAMVCAGLNECGYVYCPGDIMASNHKWQMTLGQWQKKFSTWVSKASRQAVLNISIFFDLRNIYGSTKLFKQLRSHVNSIEKNGIFLGHLAHSCLSNVPPIGFFRNFVVERSGEHKNELDLKKFGSMAINDIARLYAVSHGLKEINTVERLQKLSAIGAMNHKDARNLQDAFELVNAIRLEHQIKELKQGKKPDNFIAPKTLSNLQRNHLKDSFSIIKGQQEAINLAFPSRSS